MAKRRSGEAVAAQHRKAGPMKHRLEPKGGAKSPIGVQSEEMNWDVDPDEPDACGECGYAGNRPEDCCEACRPTP